MDRETELQATIERARAFDPDAWESLYRRLYPRLRAYARRRLAEPMCDDAVSEAFTRAMDAIERFDWGAGGFDGWVFGILRNVVFEHYRTDRSDGVPPHGGVAEQASDEHGRLSASSPASGPRGSPRL